MSPILNGVTVPEAGIDAAKQPLSPADLQKASILARTKYQLDRALTGVKKTLPAAVLIAATAGPAMAEEPNVAPVAADTPNTLVVSWTAQPNLLRDKDGNVVLLAAADARKATDTAPVSTETTKKTATQLYLEELAAAGPASANLPKVVSDAYEKARKAGFEPDEFIRATVISQSNRPAWINNISEAPRKSFQEVTGESSLTDANYSRVVREKFYDLADARAWLKDDQGNPMSDAQYQAYVKRLLSPRSDQNGAPLPSQADAWAGKLAEWKASGNDKTAAMTLDLFNAYAPKVAIPSREAFRRLLVVCADVAMARTMPDIQANGSNVVSGIGELAIMTGADATQLSYRVPQVIAGKYTNINHLVVSASQADQLGVRDVFDRYYPTTAKFAADQIGRTIRGLETNKALASAHTAVEEGKRLDEEGKRLDANNLVLDSLQKAQTEIGHLMDGKPVDVAVLNASIADTKKYYAAYVALPGVTPAMVANLDEMLSGLAKLGMIAQLKDPAIGSLVAVLDPKSLKNPR